MQLNFKKTWEILLKGKSTKALPVPLAFIERKPSLKLLSLTFQSNPCNWDLHLDNILLKASSCLYKWIIFIFFLLSSYSTYIQFTYAVEVCGCAYYHKYLSRIDRLLKRAFKPGYCIELFSYESIIALKDKNKLWDKITDSNSTTALDDLLPPERTMHGYVM